MGTLLRFSSSLGITLPHMEATQDATGSPCENLTHAYTFDKLWRMENTVYDRMLETASTHDLFTPENAVLLMVSGGSDSTALAYLAARLREDEHLEKLAMLHVNHKLRGQDAEDDARFVSDLAALLDIPLFLCEIDIAKEAERTGDNVEAVARRERYIAANEALASHCQHTATPFADGRILTAHTCDDRIENFYMRSIVGTGPGGFRSMLYKNGPVVRPLMDLSREDLRQYISSLEDEGKLVAKDQSGALWREDATNAHTDRFRAYVRHEIVPKAKEWLPQMPANLTRTMNLIADEDDMLEDMASSLIEENAKPVAEGAYADGFLLQPSFGKAKMPLQRRAVHKLLKEMLGADERIDTASMQAILDGFENGATPEAKPIGGYVRNIQGNLAVSANKQGVLVEPMSSFRKRRKKD